MDWEKFRAETAARVMCIELGPGWGSMPKETLVARAISYADELIKQLKEDKA